MILMEILYAQDKKIYKVWCIFKGFQTISAEKHARHVIVRQCSLGCK